MKSFFHSPVWINCSVEEEACAIRRLHHEEAFAAKRLHHEEVFAARRHAVSGDIEQDKVVFVEIDEPFLLHLSKLFRESSAFDI